MRHDPSARRAPETLYQLQSRWDDERAAQRTAQRVQELRARITADRRWLPLSALLLIFVTIAFAAATP